MSNRNQEIGIWGEDIAVAYLINKKYKLVSRNVRNEIGEIDIIMKKDEKIIFIEVKTRTTLNFGYPEEAISAGKFQRMFDCASLYISEKMNEWDGDWQIDLISIIGAYKTEYPEIIHLDAI